MHKGYLCFDRVSSPLYITRDVVFNEFAFPFASSSLSTPIPSPISPSEDTFSLPFTQLFSSSSPTQSSHSTPPLSITLSPTSPQFSSKISPSHSPPTTINHFQPITEPSHHLSLTTISLGNTSSINLDILQPPVSLPGTSIHQPPEDTSQHHTVTRSKLGIFKP